MVKPPIGRDGLYGSILPDWGNTLMSDFIDNTDMVDESNEAKLRMGVGQAMQRELAGTQKPATNARAAAFQRMAREALAEAGHETRSAEAESASEPVSGAPRLQVRDREPHGRSVPVNAPVDEHVSASSGRRAARAEFDKPLPAGASFADLLDIPDSQRDLSFGKYLRGTLTGDWRGAERELQSRAMGESTNTGGGALVPTVYSSQIIDLARVQTQVLNAGAQIVPLSAPTVVVGKWTGDPVPTFRNEAASITQTDATVDKMTFTARSLAGYTTVSREIVEDTDLDNELEYAYGRAIAIAWDNAALFGSGVAPNPLGIFNDTNITDKSALAANGLAFTYDHVIAAVGSVRGRNESVTAALMAPRSYQSLGTLKDTTGRYLSKPDYINDVPLLQTGQIPTNQTQGTSSGVASTLFVGDFRQMFIGVRTSFGINVYDQPAATTGQLLLVAWMRMDVQTGRKTAFAIRTGLL